MTFDFTGQKFGQLTVVEKLSQRDSKGKTQYRCICFCGKEVICITHSLTSQNYAHRTCGRCELQVSHKDAYISWMAMKQRCDDSSRKDYKNYGGRGITYTPRWNHFVLFLIDMGDPPKDIFGERKTLDRKEVNGNYEKDNCRWADDFEQQMNRR